MNSVAVPLAVAVALTATNLVVPRLLQPDPRRARPVRPLPACARFRSLCASIYARFARGQINAKDDPLRAARRWPLSHPGHYVFLTGLEGKRKRELDAQINRPDQPRAPLPGLASLVSLAFSVLPSAPDAAARLTPRIFGIDLDCVCEIERRARAGQTATGIALALHQRRDRVQFIIHRLRGRRADN